MKLRFVILLLLGLAQGAAAEDNANELRSQKERLAALPVVETALSAPMDHLYRKARNGSALDDLTFGLALMAGRDNTAQIPQDQRDLALLTIRERRKETWKALPALPDQPGESEVADWAKTAEVGYRQCTPCFVKYNPSLRDVESERAIQAYAEATYPPYWLDMAVNAKSGSQSWMSYVPPLKKGDAGTFVERPATLRPKFDAIFLFDTKACVTQVIGSVKQDKALLWLEADAKTATGRRARLNRALFAHILNQANQTKGKTCADGQFERLKSLLIANRPELDEMIVADLNIRLSDPRTKLANTY